MQMNYPTPSLFLLVLSKASDIIEVLPITIYDNYFFIAPLLLKQKARLERLRTELNNGKERYAALKKEVEELEKKRLESNHMADKELERQLEMEIKHLRNQCGKLEIDGKNIIKLFLSIELLFMSIFRFNYFKFCLLLVILSCRDLFVSVNPLMYICYRSSFFNKFRIFYQYIDIVVILYIL